MLLAAAAAAVVWLWTVVFPGPEKIIRKQLAAVASEASFSGAENPLLMAARAENLASRFGTNIEINVNLPGREQHDFIGRPEITQFAAEMRARMGSMKVEFLDVDVKVGPDKQSATADLTVHVATSADKDFLVQEMKITFQKFESDWLITRVETVRTLSRRDGGAFQPGPAWRHQTAPDGQTALCG